MAEQTKVHLTMFNGKGKNKSPFSPYKDKSFIFVTEKYDTLKDAFKHMVEQYSLSVPLNIEMPIRRRRLKTHLKDLQYSRIYNLALDIDKITNKEDYLKVIEYFRDKNYSVIMGKSRGWNGKNNFNIKGIIRTDISNNTDIIKKALKIIQEDLGDSCHIDCSVGNNVSLQAPSNNDFIVHYQEKGEIIRDSDLYIEDVKETLGGDYTPTIIYDNAIIDECIATFASLGYTPLTNSMNENGSINFAHYSEKKSKGGFFWFSANPLVMNHNNKDRSVSVFNIIKNTEIGKEWLKSKTKEEQKNQLIKPTNVQGYKKFLYVNERYLNFKNDDKGAMLDEFLKSNKGIFKIKSAMGTGKSGGIELCIKKAHDRNEKVIIVSNRVSVAEDFADKYNLMIYKDPSAYKWKGSLVVQYDSLHRFDLTNYDVVIFDEFASLLLHHRAGLTDNANINAVYFKILMDSKRVVVADAFLTGYEDSFFKNRDIFSIINEYKDDINLLEYKNKEFFLTSLVDKAKKLKKGEHISASFTSLNMLRVAEQDLLDLGIKVVTLTSETSQITRDIIYRRFKEDTHNAFQVILFTPTLTVGVSNVNNTVYHFHYDSGMSTDVVSSLQMIKRSRTTKEIHYYLEERQHYYDTDLSSMCNVAEKNINKFYHKKDKTLLIDIDYNTGKLKLTPLAIYINEIEVFYNILANNHANAFKLLLEYQFEYLPDIVDEEDNTFTIREKVKRIKDKIKTETMKILDKYKDETWTEEELKEIQAKTNEISEEEKAKLIMSDVQCRFKKELPRHKLTEIVNLEVESDFTFISKIKSMKTALNSLKDDEYTKYVLSKAISEDIGSLQNKNQSQFLEYLLLLKEEKFNSAYSRNEIKAKDNELLIGRKFEKFLKKIGYSWKDARLKADSKIFEFIDYL